MIIICLQTVIRIQVFLSNTNNLQAIIWLYVNIPIQIVIALYHNYHIIFTNPSARAGYDKRSIFKRSLTG